MKEKPSVTIQVLNWNGKQYLKDCFDGLLSQDYSNFKVVMIDNGSTDGSVEFVKREFPMVEIKRFDTNKGFALASNIGYGFIMKSDYVLLIGNDIKCPDHTMLSKLVATAQKEKSALTAGWEYPVDCSTEYESEIMNFNLPTLSLIGWCVADKIDGEKATTVLSGAGCVLIDTKKITYPLFPNEYFTYGEDVFLGWKATLMGHKIRFNKDAWYLHYGSGTASRNKPLKVFHSEKNRIANLLIFYEKITLIKVMPLVALESAMKMFYNLLHPSLIFATLKAWCWDVWNIGWILNQRAKIQSERKITDKELIKRMSYNILPSRVFKYEKLVENIPRIYCNIVNLNTYEVENVKMQE